MMLLIQPGVRGHPSDDHSANNTVQPGSTPLPSKYSDNNTSSTPLATHNSMHVTIISTSICEFHIKENLDVDYDVLSAIPPYPSCSMLLAARNLIISYLIISYLIISYLIISYLIISYLIVYTFFNLLAAWKRRAYCILSVVSRHIIILVQ